MKIEDSTVAAQGFRMQKRQKEVKTERPKVKDSRRDSGSPLSISFLSEALVKIYFEIKFIIERHADLSVALV